MPVMICDYKATSSLALNSGTIKDRSSNANVATRTLVAPGATNSLGANEALVIDGSVPTFVKGLAVRHGWRW